MIAKRHLYLPLLLSIILFAACKKSNVNQNKQVTIPKADTDVYIIGNLSASNGNSAITYIKNGVTVKLSDTTHNYYCFGAAKTDSDIFIGARALAFGSYFSVKTGQQTVFTTIESNIKGIAANQTGVYVVGWGYTPSYPGGIVGIYWKNGVENYIIPQHYFYTATGIALNGSDVYTVGLGGVVNGIGTKDVYCKNGVFHFSADTSDMSSHYGECITVDGNDVYTGGISATYDPSTNVQLFPCGYWKNGVLTNLSDGTVSGAVTQIVINNNDVYVAGNDGLKGVYWKNGAATYLTDSNGSPNTTIWGLTIDNGNIYAFGNTTNASNQSIGTVWKNGVLMKQYGVGTIRAMFFVPR